MSRSSANQKEGKDSGDTIRQLGKAVTALNTARIMPVAEFEVILPAITGMTLRQQVINWAPDVLLYAERSGLIISTNFLRN